MSDITGKVLRTIGIVFFGLATVMNLLGGIGTSCAAFFTKKYPPFWALIEEDLQWLYQSLVVTTVLISLVGIWVLISLIRGKKKTFRNALIVLVIGIVLAGIQYFYSLQLFGKAAPANIKFYSNVIALIIFLIMLIPGIRGKTNFFNDDSGMDKNTAGGLAAIIMGAILQTAPVWAGPSHTYQGVNWVQLLQTELNVSGLLLTGGGVGLCMRVFVDVFCQECALANLKLPKDR